MSNKPLLRDQNSPEESFGLKSSEPSDPYSTLVTYASQAIQANQIKLPFTSVQEFTTPMFPMGDFEHPVLVVPNCVPIQRVFGQEISSELKKKWEENQMIDIPLPDGTVRVFRIQADPAKLLLMDTFFHFLFVIPSIAEGSL